MTDYFHTQLVIGSLFLFFLVFFVHHKIKNLTKSNKPDWIAEVSAVANEVSPSCCLKEVPIVAGILQ